ncbi:hypothetical protein SCP_0205530 [Sparassis crispa]|uniref:Uncharacterized protein n=1 Tax=Sparassis crispa TaxID=139825 RepID=A0A401GB13_9APHY|nr:hypothetical protein SCP_0205530 [Sparassis crispa]GBE79355.1 hypothetical protein SCP_0205530 [Sparassis crispa]
MNIQPCRHSFFNRSALRQQVKRRPPKRPIDHVDEPAHGTLSKKSKHKENVPPKDPVREKSAKRLGGYKTTPWREEPRQIIDLTHSDHEPLHSTTKENVLSCGLRTTPPNEYAPLSGHTLLTPPPTMKHRNGIPPLSIKGFLPMTLSSSSESTPTPANHHAGNLIRLLTPCTPVSRSRSFLPSHGGSSPSTTSSTGFSSLVATQVQIGAARPGKRKRTSQREAVVLSQVSRRLLSSSRGSCPTPVAFKKPQVPPKPLTLPRTMESISRLARGPVHDVAASVLLDDDDIFVPSSQTQELHISPALAAKSLPRLNFTFRMPLGHFDDGEIIPTSQSQERELEIPDSDLGVGSQRHESISKEAMRISQQPRKHITSRDALHEVRNALSLVSESLEFVPSSQSQLEKELDMASVSPICLVDSSRRSSENEGNGRAQRPIPLSSEGSEEVSDRVQDKDNQVLNSPVHPSQGESQYSNGVHSQLYTSPPHPPTSYGSSLGDVDKFNLAPDTPPQLRAFRDMFNDEPSFLQDSENTDAHSCSVGISASPPSNTQDPPFVVSRDQFLRSYSLTEPESDDTPLSLLANPPIRQEETDLLQHRVPHREVDAITIRIPGKSSNDADDEGASSSSADQPLSIPHSFDEGMTYSSVSGSSSIPAVVADFFDMFDSDDSVGDI